MSSKEKICLHEREKHTSPALPSSPVEDEEEEGPTGQSQGKASSSSSSEEESESESDAESGKNNRRRLQVTKLLVKISVTYGRKASSFLCFITDVNLVAEKAKNRELINNLNNKRNTTGLLPTSMSMGSAVSQMKKAQVKRGRIIERRSRSNKSVDIWCFYCRT